MSWYHHAACQGEDPEMFFPIGSTGPAMRQLTNAKRVCARCPVQSECLRSALAAGIEQRCVGWDE
jgi:WhiB family transcriptional regulator, redox-sensing transcriptional regulator